MDPNVIAAVLVSAGSLLALGAFKKFLLPAIKRRAKKTKTKADDVAVGVIEKVVDVAEDVAEDQLRRSK